MDGGGDRAEVGVLDMDQHSSMRARLAPPMGIVMRRAMRYSITSGVCKYAIWEQRPEL